MVPGRLLAADVVYMYPTEKRVMTMPGNHGPGMKMYFRIFSIENWWIFHSHVSFFGGCTSYGTEAMLTAK